MTMALYPRVKVPRFPTKLIRKITLLHSWENQQTPLVNSEKHQSRNQETSAFVNMLMQTYIKPAQQEQRGLQAHREDQAQDGGRNQRPDSMRLRQHDDDGQRHQHGHP